MKPDTMKHRFVELRASGLSYDSIAQRLKISKQTLINWSKEFRSEIANLKAIQIECLLEKYYGLQAKRLELFGKQLAALEKELTTRDLKDIPTERLFHLIERYAGLIKQESTVVRFMETSSLPDLHFEDIIHTWEG